MDGSCLKKAIANFDRKIAALEDVKEENAGLERILSDKEDFDEEAYDRIMEKKSGLIDLLLVLNRDADLLYEELSEAMKKGEELSQDDRTEMQKRIKKVDALSKDCGETEERIKRLMDIYFSNEREKIRSAQQNSGAAINYYQTMSESKNMQPLFYDTKK